jgi:hypothetical protein
VVVVLLAIVPEPRSRTDYLVIGTAATFAALAALFVVVATSGGRAQNLFFRKRPR